MLEIEHFRKYGKGSRRKIPTSCLIHSNPNTLKKYEKGGRLKIPTIRWINSWISRIQGQYPPENMKWKCGKSLKLGCQETLKPRNFGTLKPRNMETKDQETLKQRNQETKAPRNQTTLKPRNQETKKLFKLGNPQHPSTYRLPPLHPCTPTRFCDVFLLHLLCSPDDRQSGHSTYLAMNKGQAWCTATGLTALQSSELPWMIIVVAGMLDVWAEMMLRQLVHEPQMLDPVLNIIRSYSEIFLLWLSYFKSIFLKWYHSFCWNISIGFGKPTMFQHVCLLLCSVSSTWC